MKKFFWGVAIFVLLIIGTFVGGGLYLLSYSLQPIEVSQAKHQRAYEDLFKDYPHLRGWADSLQQTGSLRDTTIVDAQGDSLHAIYAQAPMPTTKTAVIVHGYTDSSVRMLMIGYLYNHDLGYNILLPDLHFHGQSRGEAVRMGWLDRVDVMQWMEIANRRFGGDSQMVVHGISMGAATTMMVSGEPQQPYVKCFVEDCGYTSVWDQFAKELKEEFGLPAFPLLNVASWLCDLKYDWNFSEASALKQVAKCHLPMLFIHGDKDSYVPTWMAQPLYDAKPAPKELWIVPGAEHAYSYRDNQSAYTQHVAAFVGQYIY